MNQYNQSYNCIFIQDEDIDIFYEEKLSIFAHAFSVIAVQIPEEQKQPEDEETDETDHEVAMEIGHFSATGFSNCQRHEVDEFYEDKYESPYLCI